MSRTPFYFILLSLLFTSCSALFKAPISIQNSTLGELTPYTKKLNKLPAPEDKIVVAVYKFKDQTGQYKSSDYISNWSTAIPQGTTSILLKALEDSQWFTTIERENISDLLNERQIIKSTRQEYTANQPNATIQQLPPLLFAGVILEGGIVSYDSNIITGGAGARYFGIGASTQYRQDRVSVYLRAVSTNNGEIIKTVYTSKTILSQSLTGNMFRYVDADRLFEADIGVTRNEPVHLAVKEAIEKSVYALILEGIKEKLWAVDSGSNISEIMQAYEDEGRINEYHRIDNRLLQAQRGIIGLTTMITANTMKNDYTGGQTNLGPRVGINLLLNKHISISPSLSMFSLENKGLFKRKFIALDTNIEYFLMPKDNISPYLFAGIGIMKPSTNSNNKIHFKGNTGLGLEYLPKPNLGIRLFGAYDYGFDDKWDDYQSGKRKDHMVTFGAGLSFYFGQSLF